MTRKKTSLFIIVSLIALVIFVGCGQEPPKDGVTLPGTKPGSSSDTLTAIFTNQSVTGTVNLSAAAMSYLRSGQGGSSGDTLILYMAKRVCQPGSSGDTCYTVIGTKLQ